MDTPGIDYDPPDSAEIRDAEDVEELHDLLVHRARERGVSVRSFLLAEYDGDWRRLPCRGPAPHVDCARQYGVAVLAWDYEDVLVMDDRGRLDVIGRDYFAGHGDDEEGDDGRHN